MVRSGSKPSPELRKDHGRFISLLWLVALVLWLALSYSRWYPYITRISTSTHPFIEDRLWRNASTHSFIKEHLWRSASVQQVAQKPLHFISNAAEEQDIRSLSRGIEEKGSLQKLNEQYSLLTADRNTSFQEGPIESKAAAGEEAVEEAKLQVDDDDDADEIEPAFIERDETRQDEKHTHSDTTVEDPPRNCASVEEMGRAAAGNVATASLRLRQRIAGYLAEHGAKHVRHLPPTEFCRRGFVYGRATEDGLGNDIYKILTAAGLSMMLNRTLIIGEHGSTNPSYLGLTGHLRFPFGDYLKYSTETFSVRELKQLWVKHDCAGKFRRPLRMRVDDYQRPTRTKVFCEDWTKWQHPIIWFKGTTDSNALQFFLRNVHPTMRLLATLLLGDPKEASSRPNVFGELFRAFISPMPVVEEAVQWALRGGPDPDMSIHMRMLNSRSRAGPYAVSSCIQTLVKKLIVQNNILPRVVIVSDTGFVIRHLKQQLKGYAHVINFDYRQFVNSYQNLSKVMRENYFQPPDKRVRDWGSMPRWVAIVDLFLASRAKTAVISGANRRVSTTYAQLLASLAAAMSLSEKEEETSLEFGFYSSFQAALLTNGLAGQRGWGHTWRPFGGHLSCPNQTRQCARTPLLPYAWWDGPWQSPIPRDLQKMGNYGAKILETGVVEKGSIEKTCSGRKSPVNTLELQLPSCKQLKFCTD